MVEQVDEPAWRAGHGSGAIGGHRCAEVLAKEICQFGGCSLVARWHVGVPAQQEVVGERNPVPRPYFEDFVPAVGVEGDHRQLRLRPPVGLPLIEVAHHQLAAGVTGRQRHHQGADHRVVLLAVLMGKEELARLVDQKRMKIGGQLGGDRQAQLVFRRCQDAVQRVVVPPGADEVLRDLPRVADARVDQRLLAAAEPGRLAEAEELAGLRGRHRERDGPDALDLEAQVIGTRSQFHAEGGLRVAAQHPRQPVTCHGRHCRVPLHL